MQAEGRNFQKLLPAAGLRSEACSGHGDAPLKLVDFGIAGVVRNDRPEKRLLTKCAGTVGYMAPEVGFGRLHVIV